MIERSGHEKGDRRRFLPALRGPACAWLALVLFMFSAEGLGFFLHVMEEKVVGSGCCHFEITHGEGSAGGRPSGSPATLFDREHADHEHDCSSCPICSQFMSTVAVRWNGAPLLSVPVPIGPEYPVPEPGKPSLRSRDQSRLRAPPEASLV